MTSTSVSVAAVAAAPLSIASGSVMKAGAIATAAHNLLLHTPSMSSDEVALAHPYHHSLSSVRKWGGRVEDYLSIHSWFDASKEITADFRHRALRHHAEGVFMAETIFSPTISLSSGDVIPTRWIGEQHVIEDLGFIPSFDDWVKCIQTEPWMGRSRCIEHQVEPSHAATPATEVA